MFIHDKALVETDDIGKGTRIWAFSHILDGAVVGRNCNICEHCYIESGAVIGNGVKIKNGVAVWDKVTIEDNVFVGPNAVFTNDINPRSAMKKGPDEFYPIVVRTGATIGANATIVCGVTLGRYAFVGAGSVVIRDIPDYGLVVGNPGRMIGYMCECGKRIKKSNDQYYRCECGKQYTMNDDSGLAPAER